MPGKPKTKAVAKKKPKTKKKTIIGSISPNWDDFVSDFDVLGHCAANPGERKVTLENALNRWANADLARLVRVEEGGQCGWSMWKRV